jgi:hypothetical protein
LGVFGWAKSWPDFLDSQGNSISISPQFVWMVKIRPVQNVLEVDDFDGKGRWLGWRFSASEFQTSMASETS